MQKNKTKILVGNAANRLKELPDQSVHCCITSPPYWGLRLYKGDEEMIGMESSFDKHLENLITVFDEVWRVLHNNGTLWLNYGDAYTGNGKGQPSKNSIQHNAKGTYNLKPTPKNTLNLLPKNLMMMPARIALAMQEKGWILRSEIIWVKPNPMPESVKDRPTSAHEKIFLFAKQKKYFYNYIAVQTPIKDSLQKRLNQRSFNTQTGGEKDTKEGNRSHRKVLENLKKNLKKQDNHELGANLRNVWEISTKPYKEAHFATYPPDLIEPCIKAGTKIGDTILDPFGGAGTTALVANRLQRDAISIEISPEYAEMQRKRLIKDNGMLSDVKVK